MYDFSKHKYWLLAWLLLMSSVLVQCMSCAKGGTPSTPSNSSNLKDYMIKNIKDDELKKLVEKLNKGEKVDLNQRNTYGELPLELAFKEMWREDIVKFLLEKGADVNLIDELGNTPLMNAVSSSSYIGRETIKILLEAGSNKDVQNKEGKTALMLAVIESHKSADEVDLLVKAGADVNKQDQEGKTALHLALETSITESIVKILLKSPQINLLVKDNKGNLVFHELAEMRRVYMSDTAFKQNVSLLINKMKSQGIVITPNQWNNKVGYKPWELLLTRTIITESDWKDAKWLKKQLTASA
jgi:ankyrin repeat protein